MKHALIGLFALAALGCGDPYPPEPPDPELARVIAAAEAWVANPTALPAIESDPCSNAGPPACEWKANAAGGNIWKCRDVCGGTFWFMEFDQGGALCFTSDVWGYACNGFAP